MNLQNAITAFRNCISDEFVETDDNALAQYAMGMYTGTQKILAIIKPANTEEVKQCVQIANEYNIPLYPVSKGCNWGYGSKVPVTDNNIVIDLRRLDKITDFNEEFGYVTVEPGVSLGQLYQFLRDKKSQLLISTTGGSVASSLIGNTMERGIATGPYAERLAHVCGFEVVLPDGKIIQTGFRRFGEDVSGKVFKWGVGPYVDGLFTQSNLGIVTSMTMWLMAIPEYFHIVYYEAGDAEKYYKLVDELHDMSSSGLVRPTLTMFNNFRVLSTLRQYPWDNLAELDKLSSWDKINKVLEYTNANMGIKLWTGEICVRGVSKEHATVQSNAIKERITEFADNVYVFEISKSEMLDILEGRKNLPVESPQDVVKGYLIGKYLGMPVDTPINQCYWRKKTPIPAPMDPDRDKCGMIWICPIVPFNGSYTKKAISLIEEITVKYSYEPAISMQCMSERSIHIIASIAWDREVPGEDENAIRYYNEMHDVLHKEGFYFYRETTYSMVNRQGTLTDYDTFLINIKKAIDPKNILAPGRYIKNI